MPEAILDALFGVVLKANTFANQDTSSTTGHVSRGTVRSSANQDATSPPSLAVHGVAEVRLEGLGFLHEDGVRLGRVQPLARSAPRVGVNRVNAIPTVGFPLAARGRSLEGGMVLCRLVVPSLTPYPLTRLVPLPPVRLLGSPVGIRTNFRSVVAPSRRHGGQRRTVGKVPSARLARFVRVADLEATVLLGRCELASWLDVETAFLLRLPRRRLRAVLSLGEGLRLFPHGLVAPLNTRHPVIIARVLLGLRSHKISRTFIVRLSHSRQIDFLVKIIIQLPEPPIIRALPAHRIIICLWFLRTFNDWRVGHNMDCGGGVVPLSRAFGSRFIIRGCHLAALHAHINGCLLAAHRMVPRIVPQP